MCLWVALPAPGLGQRVPDAGEVARQYLDFLAEGRWGDAAALVHPATAEFLRRAMLARFECIAPDAAIELELPGTQDLAELRGLDAKEVVARYLAAHRRLGRGDGPRAYHPAVVLGQVREVDWVNVLYRYAYELEEDDPSGDVGFYRPAPRIVRLRVDEGRPWIAWGLHGPYASGTHLARGALSSFRSPRCPSPP